MPLEPASSEFHLTAFAAELPEAPLQLVPEPDVFSYAAWHEFLPVEHSPPDIQVLNSTFLI